MERIDTRQHPLPPATPRFHRLHRLRRDPHVLIHELLSERGDFIRWRGFFDVYLVNHPDYVRRVLAQGHDHFSKRTIDYRVLGRVMGRGLVTNDGADWEKQRRLMQPLFSSRNVNRFDAVINALSEDLVADWERRCESGPLWVDREMSRLTFRIVGRTLFGTDIDAHAQEMGSILEAVNLEPQELRALMTLFSWLPTPHNRKWKRAMRRLDEIVYDMIAQQRGGDQADDNLLARLVNARDEQSGDGLSAARIRDEVVTLMLAGHETSANALSWTLYLLGVHPEIQRRLFGDLAAELRGAPADAAALSRLPYLKQVVQESMRLYPPVWAVARRCEQAEVVGSRRLPAGSYVAVAFYALHRNPEFWPDPERFDPDRFSPGRSQGRHSYCYLPFAAGPRTCIGAGMAMLEIQLVLAQIVQRFEVHPVPGHPVASVAKVTLKPRHGLPLHVRPR